MASKIKVDELETGNGSGTIALQNQLSGMTTASLPTLTSAQMPVGSVLQVVSATLSSQVAITTSMVNTDIGLTATITPTSTSSKILIMYKINYCNSSGAGQTCNLVRGSTQIGNADTGTGVEGFLSMQTANMNTYWSLEAAGSYLDSPSTTSAAAYKFTVIAANTNSSLITFNRTARLDAYDPLAVSTITLMEIQG